MTAPGYSRAAASVAGDREPAAILSVDPQTRTAVAILRSRYTVNVNCAYSVGDATIIPAVGEQWYVERFDMEWRLAGRIPFNDETLLVEPSEGQVSVGSTRGPLELHGSQVNVRSNLQLGDTLYRDHQGALESSADNGTTWSVVAPGGPAGSVDWVNITDKPTQFPPSPHTHDYTSDITGKPATFPPSAHTHDYTTGITGKPSTFPPSAHTHAETDITGLTSDLTTIDSRLSALESSSGGSGGMNISPYVYVAAAATGTATTDTASIQTAHDSLPANGGTIILRGGDYAMTDAGVNFTKRINIIGQGMGTDDAVAATRVYSTGATATAFTLGVGGCTFRNFNIENIYAGNPTSGAGIAGAVHSSLFERIWVYGYYDNLNFTSGHYWKAHQVYSFSPVRYGLAIQDTDHNDSGDMVVDDCIFDVAGVSRNPTAAIFWKNGSGLRVTNTKVNGGTGGYKFGYAVDIAFDPSGTSSPTNSADIFIQNNSFENQIYASVRIQRAAGTYSLYNVKVQGNEFQNIPIAVQIGVGVVGWTVEGNTGQGMSSYGVDVLAGADVGRIGKNTWLPGSSAPLSCVRLAAGVSPYIEVIPQHLQGDGVIITDNAVGGAVAPSVVYDYQRSINFTVSATPHTLWSMGLTNYIGCYVEVTVTGTHSGTGGFTCLRRAFWNTDGAGATTNTNDANLVNTVTGATQNPVIGFSFGTNTAAVQISTTNGADLLMGQAIIRVRGHLASFKVGA